MMQGRDQHHQQKKFRPTFSDRRKPSSGRVVASGTSTSSQQARGFSLDRGNNFKGSNGGAQLRTGAGGIGNYNYGAIKGGNVGHAAQSRNINFHNNSSTTQQDQYLHLQGAQTSMSAEISASTRKVHQNLFEEIIRRNATYGQLLQKIKQAYEQELDRKMAIVPAGGTGGKGGGKALHDQHFHHQDSTLTRDYLLAERRNENAKLELEKLTNDLRQESDKLQKSQKLFEYTLDQLQRRSPAQRSEKSLALLSSIEPSGMNELDTEDGQTPGGHILFSESNYLNSKMDKTNSVNMLFDALNGMDNSFYSAGNITGTSMLGTNNTINTNNTTLHNINSKLEVQKVKGSKIKLSTNTSISNNDNSSNNLMLAEPTPAMLDEKQKELMKQPRNELDGGRVENFVGDRVTAQVIHGSPEFNMPTVHQINHDGGASISQQNSATKNNNRMNVLASPNSQESCELLNQAILSSPVSDLSSITGGCGAGAGGVSGLTNNTLILNNGGGVGGTSGAQLLSSSSGVINNSGNNSSSSLLIPTLSEGGGNGIPPPREPNSTIGTNQQLNRTSSLTALQGSFMQEGQIPIGFGSRPQEQLQGAEINVSRAGADSNTNSATLNSNFSTTPNMLNLTLTPNMLRNEIGRGSAGVVGTTLSNGMTDTCYGEMDQMMEASHYKNQGTRPSSSVPAEELVHNGTSTRHNKLGAAKRLQSTQQQSASTSSAVASGPPAAIPIQIQQQQNIATQQVFSSAGVTINPRGPPAPPDIDSSLRTLSPLETPEKVLSLNAKARMKLGVENKVDRYVQELEMEDEEASSESCGPHHGAGRGPAAVLTIPKIQEPPEEAATTSGANPNANCEELREQYHYASGSPSFREGATAPVSPSEADSSVEGGPRFEQRVFHPKIKRPDFIPVLDLNNLSAEESSYESDEEEEEDPEDHGDAEGELDDQNLSEATMDNAPMEEDEDDLEELDQGAGTSSLSRPAPPVVELDLGSSSGDADSGRNYDYQENENHGHYASEGEIEEEIEEDIEAEVEDE
ncbi:unnamed protein product [Amoebophrya sp. A120]|nr:unnamed protein product [Amoebophrya sp. A120]|eukprot:GSA120T00019654001.1